MVAPVIEKKEMREPNLCLHTEMNFFFTTRRGSTETLVVFLVRYVDRNLQLFYFSFRQTFYTDSLEGFQS